MSILDETRFGFALAANRQNGTVSPIPLKRISSQEQSESVQWEANLAFREQAVGYVMAATTVAAQKRLGCEEPIVGSLFASTVYPSGSSIRLPAGLLGAGCGWAFTLGLPYPQLGQAINRETLKPVIVGCATTIDVLGRRIPGDIPLNAWTGTADFGLHAFSIVSRSMQPDWRALASCQVSLAIDSHVLAKGASSDLLDHPLDPVLWLVEAMRARGQSLNALDRIFVGSCTDLLQVLPGQYLQAVFAGMQGVDVRCV